MKTGFNDPIDPKIKIEKKKTPWDFHCPPYDERSSCFVNTGTHYGMAKQPPVGHHGDPKERAATLPFGRPNTMETYQYSKPYPTADFQE